MRQPLSMYDLKKEIMENPDLLDEIISDFRMNARDKGYNEKTINDMIRAIIENLY